MSAPAWTWQRIARRIRVPLGFVLAAVYLWLAQPSPLSLAAGAAPLALGLWLRGVASGHVRKDAELTTTGPYRYTRNPLYLGSVLVGIGLGIAAWNLWLAAVLVVLFLAIYWPVILSEEEFLRRQFPGYAEYARQVPRLLPRLRAAGGPPGSFSRALYLQHREYNALIGSMAMILALVVKARFWGAAR